MLHGSIDIRIQTPGPVYTYFVLALSSDLEPDRRADITAESHRTSTQPTVPVAMQPGGSSQAVMLALTNLKDRMEQTCDSWPGMIRRVSVDGGASGTVGPQ
jgi:hypothetical protein